MKPSGAQRSRRLRVRPLSLRTTRACLAHRARLPQCPAEAGVVRAGESTSEIRPERAADRQRRGLPLAEAKQACGLAIGEDRDATPAWARDPLSCPRGRAWYAKRVAHADPQSGRPRSRRPKALQPGIDHAEPGGRLVAVREVTRARYQGDLPAGMASGSGEREGGRHVVVLASVHE